VSFHANATVLYREIPVMSEFQIDLIYDRVEELCLAHDCLVAPRYASIPA
jgi:hypothetical protein